MKGFVEIMNGSPRYEDLDGATLLFRFRMFVYVSVQGSSLSI